MMPWEAASDCLAMLLLVCFCATVCDLNIKCVNINIELFAD